MNIFQGDPAIKMTKNGATLVFKGGQPVMDQGVENESSISLFTEEGWPGNYLLPPKSRIGSKFEKLARGPITLSKLALIEQSAVNAHNSAIFGKITAEASNPESWRTDVKILISPPGGNKTEILLTSNGQNWINQAANPAHERLA